MCTLGNITHITNNLAVNIAALENYYCSVVVSSWPPVSNCGVKSQENNGGRESEYDSGKHNKND